MADLTALGTGTITFTGLGIDKIVGLTPDEVGILAATTGAIGEADTEIGGLFQTRLTAALLQYIDLTATYTWDGTTTVLSADTSEVEVDDYIQLNTDGQLFKVITVTTDTSVEIENPNSLTIPTGSTTSSKAVQSLPVESAFEWPDSGRVSLNGIAYTYASRTQLTLDGITHQLNGETIPGLFRNHRLQATVTDVTKARSALDLVRRAMLVAFAEEDDLSALGRNLGVPRLPFLKSDDLFRRIIQALAYNPRGTFYGIELALNGLVGEGNFEISEHLIKFNNTVFIKLLGAATTEEISEGKAFITGRTSQPAVTNDTLNIPAAVVTRGAVGGVRWKDEDHLTDLSGTPAPPYPTGDLISEYSGETPKPVWAASGGHTEGVDVTFISADGGVLEMTTSAADIWYRHLMRIQPESEARASWLINIPTAGTLTSSYLHGIRVLDTNSGLAFGIRDGTAGSTFRVAFANLAFGTIIGSNTVELSRDTYHDIEIRKDGTNAVELWVNGVFQFSEPYASFPAATLHTVDWGRFTGPDSEMRIKHVAFYAKTLTDYWSARGTTADVGAPLPDNQIDVNATIFQSGVDVGKRLVTRGSGVTNPQGGNNNGIWEVLLDTAPQVATLIGTRYEAAILQSAFPTRVTLPTQGQQFQYPDDLGKEIEILDSGLGNSGSYTIVTLLEPGTLADLSAGASPPPAMTNIAVVSGASFVTEIVDWRINPKFVTEANLEWEMSDAGDVTGTLLTLRQNLPITTGGYTRVLDVLFSEVLSAQILLDTNIANILLQEFPDLLFSYYPFYISDPLGFVRAYLDDITAAGVIPDYLFD
jgi:hypothetical protein